MTTFEKLKTTPIKEIIYTIAYNQIVDEKCFEKFINTDFVKETFKATTTSAAETITIESKNNSGQTKVFRQQDGLIIRNLSKIIQVRKGSFSYHKVNEYESYDNLLDELIKYWDLFDDSTIDNLTINNISIRYINFIEQRETEKVTDLITFYSKNNFNIKADRFQNQLSFKYPNFDVNVNVVTAKVSNENKNGILLDISLNKKILQPYDRKQLLVDYKNFRNIKNDIFFKSITDLTKKKYSDE